MEERLRTILGEVGGLNVPIGQVGGDEDLFGVGLTSLATVSLLIAIEEEFGIEVPDALLKRETFRSIDVLLGVIVRLGGDRG